MDISPTTKPTTHVINVTPAVAKRWLKNNTINRRLHHGKVSQYARAMAAGQWTVSNDDICFDPDGRLLNGQHRLHAVIQSDCTVVMTIKRNVPTEAMRHMDRGTKRTYAQQLTFAGEKHAALLGSVLNQAYQLHQGWTHAPSNAVGDVDMDAFLDEHPDIRISVGVADKLKGKINCPPTAIAVAHWFIIGVETTGVATRYLQQVGTPVNEPEGSAVLAVASRLNTVARQSQRYDTKNYVYLLLKGWNYYAGNKSVRMLNMQPKGLFQLPAVQPWTRLDVA